MNRKIESVALAGLIAFTAACDQSRPVTQPSPASASAEPTPAPKATPSPEIPVAATNPQSPVSETPKSPEEGWDRFVSLNFPYQIDYPQEWTTKKSWDGWDLFLSDKRSREYSSLHISGVRIKAENIPDWITLETYTQQRKDSVGKITKNVHGKGSVAGVAAESLIYTYTWDTRPTEIRTFNEILQGGYGSVVVSDTLILKDRKIWNIQFVADASDPNMEADYQKYLKMLDNLKFLR